MQPLADLAGAGERHRLQRLGVDQRLSQLAARPGDEVDHAFRHARFMQRFDDPPRAERRRRGRLEHHRVAANQRRRQLPGGNRGRKIPGRNQTHHAERLADGEHMDAIALGGNQHAGHARAFAAEVAQDVDGAPHFALGFGQRLAFLARHVGAELIELAIHDVGGLVQQIAASRRRHRRPGWEGRGSRGGGIGHILRRALREEADHLIRIRRIAILEGLRRSGPLAIDVVLKSLHTHGSPDLLAKARRSQTSLQALLADSNHLARSNRPDNFETRGDMRQEVGEPVRPGSENENGDSPARQILFILDAFVHGQEDFEAADLRECK